VDVPITELEKIEADRIDGVGQPANGIPILLLKQVADPEPVEKDWAAWDAAHEGGGKGGGKAAAGGDSKASAADAVARAKQTIADHKAGKKVSAAELKNAHEVHEAHLAHEAKLKAEAEAKAKGSAAKPAAKPAAKNPKAAKALAKMIIAAPDSDPALLLKAVGADGEVDEGPDVEGGTRVLEMIADLIIAEAQELKAGQAGEIADLFELCCAAEKIWCWRTGEEAAGSGSVMPATALMQSAADGTFPAFITKAVSDWTPEMVTAFAAEWDKLVAGGRAPELAKSGPTAEERRQAASEGNALSDGSYPIRNERELHAAAILARSGHGDVAGAKRLIARRAKELGVANPLEDDGDASKGAGEGKIAEDGKTMDTVTQETGGLTKAVEDAIAKATQPLQERIKALDAELAKVKATPVPGGLVLSRNVQVKQPGAVVNEDYAAKAAYYREMAETVTDRPTADGYRKLAREADAKAVTPTS